MKSMAPSTHAGPCVDSHDLNEKINDWIPQQEEAKIAVPTAQVAAE